MPIEEYHWFFAFPNNYPFAILIFTICPAFTFCHYIFICTLKISLNDLLEIKITSNKSATVNTFADFFSILIDLDRRGLQIKGKTTYSQEDNQLTAHLTLDIPNAQIAAFIPDWNKVNQALISGKMDKEEYGMRLEDTLKLFNVPIDEYI